MMSKFSCSQKSCGGVVVCFACAKEDCVLILKDMEEGRGRIVGGLK